MRRSELPSKLVIAGGAATSEAMLWRVVDAAQLWGLGLEEAEVYTLPQQQSDKSEQLHKRLKDKESGLVALSLGATCLEQNAEVHWVSYMNGPEPRSTLQLARGLGMLIAQTGERAIFGPDQVETAAVFTEGILELRRPEQWQQIIRHNGFSTSARAIEIAQSGATVGVFTTRNDPFYPSRLRDTAGFDLHGIVHSEMDGARPNHNDPLIQPSTTIAETIIDKMAA